MVARRCIEQQISAFICYTTQSDFQWALKQSQYWFILLGLCFDFFFFKLLQTAGLFLGTSLYSIRKNNRVSKITLWNVSNLAVIANEGTDQVKFEAKLPFTSSRISLYKLFKSLKKHKASLQSILRGDKSTVN